MLNSALRHSTPVHTWPRDVHTSILQVWFHSCWGHSDLTWKWCIQRTATWANSWILACLSCSASKADFLCSLAEPREEQSPDNFSKDAIDPTHSKSSCKFSLQTKNTAYLTCFWPQFHTGMYVHVYTYTLIYMYSASNKTWYHTSWCRPVGYVLCKFHCFTITVGFLQKLIDCCLQAQDLNLGLVGSFLGTLTLYWPLYVRQLNFLWEMWSYKWMS